VICVSQISQTCCSRTIDRTAFVLGSFERSTPVVWFDVTVLGYHVTLTYLFSATVRRNLVVSLCSVDLRENRSRYRNYFNGQVLGNRVWNFHSVHCTAFATALCIMFQTLYFRNGCIDLHVWYIAGMLIKTWQIDVDVDDSRHSLHIDKAKGKLASLKTTPLLSGWCRRWMNNIDDENWDIAASATVRYDTSAKQ